MIKVAVPRMLCDVIDKTIQVHGGAGVCQDFPLAQWLVYFGLFVKLIYFVMLR